MRRGSVIGGYVALKAIATKFRCNRKQKRRGSSPSHKRLPGFARRGGCRLSEQRRGGLQLPDEGDDDWPPKENGASACTVFFIPGESTQPAINPPTAYSSATP